MNYLELLSATDNLGRKLSVASGFKKDKYVGLFYFLWHGQHSADKVRNVTELLRTNYDDLFDPSDENTIVPYGSWLHYHEPLYGYYNSEDEWVMRKHIELFITIGVDFLMMDFTNACIYWKPLILLMDLLSEYHAAGWDVPRVSFYINLKANELTRALYERIYQNDKYKDLVFYGNYEKPLIVSVPHELDAELQAYFHVRASRWHQDQYPDTVWTYWDITRDWKKYAGMMNISIAQCGTAFSYVFKGPDPNRKYEAWGRGYTTVSGENGNVNAILRGDNVQEAWNAVFKLDPEYVFITGWNEWVVQKINIQKRFPQYHTKPFANYTDNFNVEFSRDIEMTKAAGYVTDAQGGFIEEGYGDNYLIQLAENIRRFKGIETLSTEPMLNVSIYKAIATKNIMRDCVGFYQNTHYKQPASDNFIRQVQISHDEKNLYFTITASQTIRLPNDASTNFMNLFICVEGSDQPTWSGFHYVVNRCRLSSNQTSVERFAEDNLYTFSSVGSVEYLLKENTLQFIIPRDLLQLQARAFSVAFKVADGVCRQADILDYYVTGTNLPIGRFAYRYQGE